MNKRRLGERVTSWCHGTDVALLSFGGKFLNINELVQIGGSSDTLILRFKRNRSGTPLSTGTEEGRIR